MSNSQENRVLGRLGARLLSEEELKNITGGFQTAACTFDPIACQVLDGDCSKIPPACGGQ
jgi:bacteriocin-like protein